MTALVVALIALAISVGSLVFSIWNWRRVDRYADPPLTLAEARIYTDGIFKRDVQ